MIRYILYRVITESAAGVTHGDWQRGILHGFTAGGEAIVEAEATCELRLVKANPASLKFEVSTPAWLKAQEDAQNRQRAAGRPV